MIIMFEKTLDKTIKMWYNIISKRTASKKSLQPSCLVRDDPGIGTHIRINGVLLRRMGCRPPDRFLIVDSFESCTSGTDVGSTKPSRGHQPCMSRVF